MRAVAPLVALVALSFSSSALLAQRQLQLVATVTSPTGADFATIEPAAVRITENGAQATILKVEVATQTPKVQILVDNGLGFPSEGIGNLRTGVRGLLDAIPAGVEVGIYTTAPQPRPLQAPTTDRARLIAALDRLAPDSGAGRFVESLNEAMQRVERDPTGRYVIVSFATSAGDATFRERDVQQIQQRALKFQPTVHVALLNTRATGSGGVIQTDLGQAITTMTSGQFEVINVPGRVATLLPEWGAVIGKTLGGASKQMRVTFERPNGASGELGDVSIAVTGKIVSNVALAN